MQVKHHKIYIFLLRVYYITLPPRPINIHNSSSVFFIFFYWCVLGVITPLFRFATNRGGVKTKLTEHAVLIKLVTVMLTVLKKRKGFSFIWEHLLKMWLLRNWVGVCNFMAIVFFFLDTPTSLPNVTRGQSLEWLYWQYCRRIALAHSVLPFWGKPHPEAVLPGGRPPGAWS